MNKVTELAVKKLTGGAVINVCLTVVSGVSRQTFACVTALVVYAFTTISAWVVFAFIHILIAALTYAIMNKQTFVQSHDCSQAQCFVLLEIFKNSVMQITCVPCQPVGQRQV